MDQKIAEIAERICELRDVWGYSAAEMAEIAGVSEEEYALYEAGKKDFSFTFLYNIAEKLHVDLTELLTGETPHLSAYSVIRSGEGLPIKRREGFEYYHMAYLVKEKIAEPFVVIAPYMPENDTAPIHLNYHEGQEFDYILEGSLRVRIDDSEFVLNEGDCFYYNSGHGHGMVATGGKPCRFLAVVMKKVQNTERKN